MANTNVSVDGITVPGVNWSNQTYSTSLESYGNGLSYLLNPPLWNNYLGWTMITEDAIATTTHPATNTNLLTRIFVPQGGNTTKVDLFPLSNVANISNLFIGLYSATGSQLAVTAESHAAIAASGNGNTCALSWVTSYNTIAGTFYYLATTIGWSSAAPTFAGCSSANAAALNAGLTVATAEAASNGTATTLPASYTMASNVFTSFEYFMGIR